MALIETLLHPQASRINWTSLTATRNLLPEARRKALKASRRGRGRECVVCVCGLLCGVYWAAVHGKAGAARRNSLRVQSASLPPVAKTYRLRDGPSAQSVFDHESEVV